MDAGEEQEAVKDYGSFKHPPVDEGDIAAHHTDRWQNQAMYVGLHFAHNPNRAKRRRHKHRHKHHKPDHKSEGATGEEHDSAKPPTPPSQRVQFLLGQDDGDEDHMSHDIFCEMEELRAVGEEGDVEWKETARWIKFEEDVEEGGERWSKPHVATLSLHSLFELRKGILSGTVMLDLDATNIMQITELVLDNMLASKQLEAEHRERVQEVLLSRHRHQHEKEKKGIPIIRSLADIGKKHSSKTLEDKDGKSMSKKGSSKDLHDGAESGADLSQTPSMTKMKKGEGAFDFGQRRMSMFDRLLDLAALPMHTTTSSKDIAPPEHQFNEHFLKKIPQGAEASNVLVGEVDFLNHPIIAFVRLSKAQMLGDLTEVPVPTRFIFILLGPQGNQSRYHEIGRSIATLMSDEVFHDVAYKAKDRGDLLAGIDEFLDQVTVLPPGEWDPTIRIEPPKSVPSQEGRKHQGGGGGGGLPNGLPTSGGDDGDGEGPGGGEDHGDPTLVRTGKFFGGLRADLKRKVPFYLSDYKDCLHVQCIASVFFMYFACLTPIITFGGLLGAATDDNMAAIESLLAGAICGISYHLFAGQPLTIIGSTGPVLVFETIVYNFCRDNGLVYLSMRFWIGLWVFVALLIIVAFDLSALVRYITRFTEESFACLIALIFIYEAFKKLFHILDHDGVYRSYDPHHPPDYACRCVPDNDTVIATTTIGPNNETIDPWNTRDKDDCKALHGTLKGIGCNHIPDVFFWSCLLFIMTFVLSYWLKMFRNRRVFPAKIRAIISDFAVMIAILSAVGADVGLGLHTPKLNVPEDFKPTRSDRGWVINPFRNPWWCAPAAILPAALATILIFMDQQITAVIVNRKENKLKKGAGYHLDLLLIAIQIGICSVLGIPWFVAATVLSINHVRSLTVESESAAPGEKPRFLGIREQRLTGIVVFFMCGVSVLFTGALKLIPMPVLYGVFLFMGVSSLKGVQLVQRIFIVLMPPKYQPDYVYLRHVPLRRVHLFTAVQVLCLVILWVIKTIKSISIVFPLMVLAMCFVRKGLDWVFTRHELTWLDDIMPETHKKEKEEKTNKLKVEQEDTEPPEKKLSITYPPGQGNAIEMTGGAINIPLKDGKSINIPVDRITYDPESNQVKISEEMGKTAIWKQLAANESNPDFQVRNRKLQAEKLKKENEEAAASSGTDDRANPVKFSIEGASSDEHLDSPQIVIDPPSKAGTPDDKPPSEANVSNV